MGAKSALPSAQNLFGRQEGYTKSDPVIPITFSSRTVSEKLFLKINSLKHVGSQNSIWNINLSSTIVCCVCVDRIFIRLHPVLSELRFKFTAIPQSVKLIRFEIPKPSVYVCVFVYVRPCAVITRW